MVPQSPAPTSRLPQPGPAGTATAPPPGLSPRAPRCLAKAWGRRSRPASWGPVLLSPYLSRLFPPSSCPFSPASYTAFHPPPLILLCDSVFQGRVLGSRSYTGPRRSLQPQPSFTPPSGRGGRGSPLPRTLEPKRAFPWRPTARLRGRREKSRCGRCLPPAAQRAPPVEVNSPRPFLSSACPPSALPRFLQPPDSGRSLRSAHLLRCSEP